MVDVTDLYSTPEPYATPQQIESTRAYAKALLSGSGMQPVHHWTQGVSNMVNALVAGGLNNLAGQQERQGLGLASQQRFAPAPVAPPTNPPLASVGAITSPNDAPSSGGQKNSDDVKQANSEIKPDEPYRLAGPEAMDAWRKEVDHPNAAVKADVPDSDVVKAFAGPDGGPSNPAAQAISTALRGGNPDMQVAAAQKPMAAPVGSKMLPNPNGEPGQTYIHPNLVPRVPQYTEEQVRGALANPWVPESVKQDLLNKYQTQGQPVSVPYLGGAVIVNPNNPTQQQFIPQGNWSEKQIGEIKRQIFQYPDGKGNVIEAPLMQPNPGGAPPISPANGPRSEAAPAPGGSPAPAAPVTAPQAPAGPTPAPGPATAQSVPVPPTMPPAAPVQVASADPTAAFAAAAGKPSVPGMPPAAAVPPAETAPATPLAKMAAGPPPPGISQQDWDTYTQKKNYDNDAALEQEAAKAKIEVDKGYQTKAADFAAKKYDTLSTGAQAARKQMPNLDLGLAMMNDKNFHSGLLSGAQDVWARLKEAVGGDRLANAPNEAFDKIMAGTILDNMHTALQGLGQVRLAEIGLLTKANANRNNTDASNRAVLEVSRRAVQNIDHLDNIGQQYASGDEVTDPISGKVMLKANVVDGEITPRHGLDVGYDKLARKFTLEHPSFNPDEIKRYETIFDTGSDPNAAPVTPGAPGQTGQAVPQTFPDIPGGAIQDLKKNPNTASQFDEVFGPGAAAKILGTK